MSEYTPTPTEARAECVANKGFRMVTGWRGAEEFDRMIAEVERAAAEKAWDEALGSCNDYSDAAPNPYREGPSQASARRVGDVVTVTVPFDGKSHEVEL